jgi:hypothetical protein
MSQPVGSKCSIFWTFVLFAGLAEVDHVALAARRGEHRELVDREFPLGQDVQHFTPDIAGGACDHDTVAHFRPSIRIVALAPTNGSLVVDEVECQRIPVASTQSSASRAPERQARLVIRVLVRGFRSMRRP